jgi:prenyltransferase beta subunit
MSLQNKESFDFYATEHFRMSGVYWGLTAMQILGKLHLMDKDAILDWVLSCQKEDGGFGGSERHDSHLLYTLSAVQILVLCDALDRMDKGNVLSCASLAAICSLIPLALGHALLRGRNPDILIVLMGKRMSENVS